MNRNHGAQIMLAGLALAGVCGAATAATAADKPGRYTMTPTDGGMVKLDTATGATSFCTRSGADWSCTPTKDGDQALRQRIEELEGEIVVLKEQLKKMDEIVGLGDPGEDRPRRGPPGDRPTTLPSEKDVDQAFDYLERMMRTIRKRLDKLEGQRTPQSAPL
jgi:hypothetical protein